MGMSRLHKYQPKIKLEMSSNGIYNNKLIMNVFGLWISAQQKQALDLDR
jgi:hypothetical protein